LFAIRPAPQPPAIARRPDAHVVKRWSEREFLT
jgi:hypothetical protein